MNSTQHRTNLAGRIGRWSAAHWKTATFGWLGLIIVAFPIGGQVGTKTVDPNTAGPGQSGQMDRILASGFKHPAAESVLVQSNTARAGSPAFGAAVKDVLRRLSHVAAVQNVRSPLSAGDAGQISKDGHSALGDAEDVGDFGEGEPFGGCVEDDTEALDLCFPYRVVSGCSRLPCVEEGVLER